MLTLTKCRLACAVTLGLLGTGAYALPVFYENFDIVPYTPGDPAGCPPAWPGGAGTYPFPVGWLLRNVDNRTPSANVSYVNDAWEDREDFGLSVTNCVAFSTSWYSTAGQADDWMWTPAIALPAGSSTLTWRARAYDPSYPDGYEVRVMVSPNTPTGGTGVIGNQITSSTQLFSVAHEAATWTSHSIPLDAYAGQTVYVGFRNNSYDEFLLVVDDVTVIDATPDAVAQSSMPFASEYSRAPDGFTVDTTLGFTAFNGGGSALNNVIGTATYQLDAAPFGTPLTATPIVSLAVGANAPVTFGSGHTVHGNGTWSVQYDVSANETPDETNTANNTVQSAGPTIGGNEFARDEGLPSGTLGIGAGNGGEIGNAFTLLNNATIVGVRFGMTIPATVDDGTGNQIPNPFIGLPLVANLRAYDNTTPPGKPGTLIDSTVSIPASDSVGVYDATFTAGPHTLSAGTYVVTVSEPVDPNGTMPLNLHVDRFTPGTVWVNWPTNPTGDWAHIESFGNAFAKTAEVSMLTETSIFKDGFEVASAVSRPEVQTWRGPRPFAPARPLRKPAPNALSTKR